MDPVGSSIPPETISRENRREEYGPLNLPEGKVWAGEDRVGVGGVGCMCGGAGAETGVSHSYADCAYRYAW